MRGSGPTSVIRTTRNNAIQTKCDLLGVPNTLRASSFLCTRAFIPPLWDTHSSHTPTQKNSPSHRYPCACAALPPPQRGRPETVNPPTPVWGRGLGSDHFGLPGRRKNPAYSCKAGATPQWDYKTPLGLCKKRYSLPSAWMVSGLLSEANHSAAIDEDKP